MTFGSNFKIYRSLLDNRLKNEIASKFGIRNVKVFENYFNNIIHIRNVCSHGGILFDLKLPKGFRVIPVIDFSNGDRHSIYTAIKVILFVMDSISVNRKEELKADIDKLFKKYENNLVIKNIIQNSIGYTF